MFITSFTLEPISCLLIIICLYSSTLMLPLHFDINQAAKLMCHFICRRTRGVDQLSMETKQALQYRVDPNKENAERSAVEVLLYTVGCKWL